MYKGQDIVMKIAVINGSPKGKYSITLQTLNYLALKMPEHEYKVLHAGQQIKKIEKDFTESAEKIAEEVKTIRRYM